MHHRLPAIIVKVPNAKAPGALIDYSTPCLSKGPFKLGISMAEAMHKTVLSEILAKTFGKSTVSAIWNVEGGSFNTLLNRRDIMYEGAELRYYKLLFLASRNLWLDRELFKKIYTAV